MRNTLVVAVGGALGSLARWSLGLVIIDNGFPWATLLVNLTGAALLLHIIEWSEAHPYEKWWWRPLISVGFCGGYTTYSAFAVKLVEYINERMYFEFIMYAASTLIGTLLLLMLFHKVLKVNNFIHKSIVARHGKTKSESNVIGNNNLPNERNE